MGAYYKFIDEKDKKTRNIFECKINSDGKTSLNGPGLGYGLKMKKTCKFRKKRFKLFF